MLIRFQFASTAFTMTLKGVPAVCASGVPILPPTVPGTAVSPGVSNCSLANAPALTVIAGLELAVLVPSEASVAVSVQVPAVLFVRLNTFVPETKLVFAGRMLFAPVQVSATVSPALLTTFQFASTALTVTS